MNLHLRQAHGEHDLINRIGSIILLLLFFFNVYTQIIKNVNLLEEIQYTAPYFIGAVLLFIFDWKKVLSIIILLVGIHNIIDSSSPGSLEGVIFFVLAYTCYRKIPYAVFISVLTIVLLTIRSTILGDTIPQTLAIILGYFALYTLYYSIVLKQLAVYKKIQSLTTHENRIL